MARNPLLRKAFEEAAEREIEKLPKEENIIRSYSDEFKEKMEELIEFKHSATKRKIRFGKVAVVAAVLAVVLAFTASASLGGDSFFRLFIREPDYENYEKLDIEAEGAYENEEIFVEEELEYTGKPLVLRYTVDTGETWTWPDKVIMIYIDGVRQTFTAKTVEGEQENIEMLYLRNEKGRQKSFEITLEPNIGKCGDEMYLSVVAVFDPEVNYYPQCKTEHKQLRPVHYDDNADNLCDICSTDISKVKSGPASLTVQSESMIKIVMKKDAPSETRVTKNYSGLRVSDLDKTIYKSYEYADSDGKHNQYDTVEGLSAVIYKKIKDSYYWQWGARCHSTRIKTKAVSDDEFIINLHGATGKYRVSLFVNNEIQPVFDGSFYADVEVAHGKQSELTVKLDTTKLIEDDNYIYVMYEKLDGQIDEFRMVDRGNAYTVEVK